MQRFFAILAEAVERFEGTVDKFTGDGIMAVFGAPVAHEDHARRACYAALQMLDDVAEYAAELRRGPGLNFSTRIGINSGEVVAGAIGAGGEGDYTAIGHTVGLAQRMEALAEPGSAYLTEGTAALAARLPRAEGTGRVRDQGGEPAGRGLRAGRRRRRALAARPLPRARLLALRRPRRARWRSWSAALAQADAGEGAVVGIVAEAGVGKSRLSHEFAERCRARGLEVFEAQAQSHGRSIPLMPVLQMLRAYFGIGDREPERLDPREDRRPGAAARPRVRRRPAAPLRLPRRPRPRAARGADAARRRGSGRWAAIVCRLINAPRRTPHGRPRDRGPALDRREQRRRCWPRWSPRSQGTQHARGRQLPARILARLGPGADLPGPRPAAAGPGRHPASCCATWPARIPRWTASRSRSTRARRATRSSSRRSSASWSRPATSRASGAPTAWSGRSRRPACRQPCRRSSPPASTASTRTRSSCSRSPRWSARRSGRERSA